jgi:hypothetical protein
MNLINTITNWFSPRNAVVDLDDPWKLPPAEYRVASKNPYFRDALRDLSIEEDDINSYYTGILNVVADACVGTTPMILGNHQNNVVNDSIEDKWLEWCRIQNIGHALRECRRDACKAGIGIIVPYVRKTVDYPVRLAFKNIPIVDLVTPFNLDPNVDIQDGIEFNDNGDITAVWIKDADDTRYSVPDQALVWKKPKAAILPECGPAFCIFPSIRRFMKAIIRAEEFRAAIPLAMELDPMVYKPDDTMGVPSGKFEYEPGWVPTLPPGAKLGGINVSPQGDVKTCQRILLLVIAAITTWHQPKLILSLGKTLLTLIALTLNLYPDKCMLYGYGQQY